MTQELPRRYDSIQMLRAEVANADQLSVKRLHNNTRAHLQNALVYAEMSDEVYAAADAVAQAVASFVEKQERHLFGDRAAVDTSKARALETIDRLIEILINTPPSERANALGI